MYKNVYPNCSLRIEKDRNGNEKDHEQVILRPYATVFILVAAEARGRRPEEGPSHGQDR
jgi:hypothetical protein